MYLIYSNTYTKCNRPLRFEVKKILKLRKNIYFIQKKND